MSDSDSRHNGLLLEALLAEIKSFSGKLDRLSEQNTELVEQGADLKASFERLANSFLRLAYQQNEDRRDFKARIRKLESAVFYGEQPDAAPVPATVAQPMQQLTPLAFPVQAIRPPAPSYSDEYATRELNELKTELAGIKPHIEREKRRESWIYRQRNGFLPAVLIGLAVAAGTTSIAWVASHVTVAGTTQSK
jgi:hypothetical protein